MRFLLEEPAGTGRGLGGYPALFLEGTGFKSGGHRADRGGTGLLAGD
jgi:hypothetical protein